MLLFLCMVRSPPQSWNKKDVRWDEKKARRRFERWKGHRKVREILILDVLQFILPKYIYLALTLFTWWLNCKIPGPLICIRITSIAFRLLLQRMQPRGNNVGRVFCNCSCVRNGEKYFLSSLHYMSFFFKLIFYWGSVALLMLYPIQSLWE